MSEAPTEVPRSVVQVPDDPFVWLAIHSEAYVTADRALWRLKAAIEAGEVGQDHQTTAHLETLRQARRDHYQSLVSAVMTTESIRMAATP